MLLFFPPSLDLSLSKGGRGLQFFLSFFFPKRVLGFTLLSTVWTHTLFFLPLARAATFDPSPPLPPIGREEEAEGTSVVLRRERGRRKKGLAISPFSWVARSSWLDGWLVALSRFLCLLPPFAPFCFLVLPPFVFWPSKRTERGRKEEGRETYVSCFLFCPIPTVRPVTLLPYSLFKPLNFVCVVVQDLAKQNTFS